MGNILHEKSHAFARRIVKADQHLSIEKKEFVLSKQLLRSGTSIGANIRESRNAQSHSDFANKLSIALKEADETAYWLDLLLDGDYINNRTHQSMQHDLGEIIAILTSSINTVKRNEWNRIHTNQERHNRQ